MAEKACKNCKRFKRETPLSKLGTCEIVYNYPTTPEDASKRIMHVRGGNFLSGQSQIFFGEDFCCNLHLEPRKL